MCVYVGVGHSHQIIPYTKLIPYSPQGLPKLPELGRSWPIRSRPCHSLKRNSGHNREVQRQKQRPWGWRLGTPLRRPPQCAPAADSDRQPVEYGIILSHFHVEQLKRLKDWSTPTSQDSAAPSLPLNSRPSPMLTAAAASPTSLGLSQKLLAESNILNPLTVTQSQCFGVQY